MNNSDEQRAARSPRHEEHSIPTDTARVEGGIRAAGKGPRRPVGRGPVVTVVTVVRNGETFLERTIQSVIGQTYDAVELIIIDGGSTDGTLDIIRRYDAKIEYWSSEPDKGIYDAMNKGIDLATGEWVFFLNGGDELSHNEVFSQLVPELHDDIDVLYGRHEVVYDDNYSRTPALGDLRNLWKGMVFCHQSMLVRTPIMKHLKFNSESRIAADYEFIFTLYAQQRRFHAVDRVIARITADGYSSSNNLKMIREQWRVVKRFKGQSIALDCYYLGSLASVAVKNMVKHCLPGRMVNNLRSRQGI